MSTRPRSAEKCPQCQLPSPLCICEQATESPCSAEIFILRHPLERNKASNTGKWVAALLAGARLTDYAGPGAGEDIPALSGFDTALLYPSSQSSGDPREFRRFVVLDGSWSQARRMWQRRADLRSLPRVSLPPPQRALPHMRRSPGANNLSTAEAVVSLLQQIGDTRAAEHLEGFVRELARRFAIPSRRGHLGLW